jgi:cob(I)alamin adenosyltransferase
MNKIYTKTGDDGTTSFAGGERVGKDDLRIEAVGTMDELNSALGLSMSLLNGRSNNFKKLLKDIQNDIFTLGAELSTFTSKANEWKVPETTVRHVHDIECLIDKLTGEMPPQKSFILPNGNQASVALHFARTVCRRAERVLVALNRRHAINPNILKYVNRLSDLLFVMARYANRENENTTEQKPVYEYFNK